MRSLDIHSGWRISGFSLAVSYDFYLSPLSCAEFVGDGQDGRDGRDFNHGLRVPVNFLTVSFLDSEDDVCRFFEFLRLLVLFGMRLLYDSYYVVARRSTGGPDSLRPRRKDSSHKWQTFIKLLKTWVTVLHRELQYTTVVRFSALKLSSRSTPSAIM